MAKQTLDLFKLFKLVVQKGGLVEVSFYADSVIFYGLCFWYFTQFGLLSKG